MKDLNLQISTKTFTNILRRHHLTIFIIFTVAILATVVLLVNTALINPPAANPSVGETSANGTVVAPTNLDRLQNLHASDEFKAPTSTGQLSPLSNRGR